jgi:hypothetical protein
LNQLVYDFAVWVDGHRWSTMLHESYYMYNWIETTHVLTLMLSLGMLFLIDLRMLGLALPGVPATRIADRLALPMTVGFVLMFATGIALFYAIPVRTAQSLWFRIKLVLLVAAAINALLFHSHLREAGDSWSADAKAPAVLRRGALLSLSFWAGVVICGRLIAYDWFDCVRDPHPLIAGLAGCLDEQAFY